MSKTVELENIFKEFYPKLLEILPINCLILQLYSKELLSNDHKDRLQALSTNKERARCFLDEVIKPGLRVGFMDQFDEMLTIMAKSDDPPVKFLANEMISGMRSRNIAPPTQMFHDLSLVLSQARFQNTERQSK